LKTIEYSNSFWRELARSFDALSTLFYRCGKYGQLAATIHHSFIALSLLFLSYFYVTSASLLAFLSRYFHPHALFMVPQYPQINGWCHACSAPSEAARP
jgi:hypothetical protein